MASWGHKGESTRLLTQEGSLPRTGGLQVPPESEYTHPPSGAARLWGRRRGKEIGGGGLADGEARGGRPRKHQAGFSFLAKGEKRQGCLWAASWVQMKPGGQISRTQLSNFPQGPDLGPAPRGPTNVSLGLGSRWGSEPRGFDQRPTRWDQGPRRGNPKIQGSEDVWKDQRDLA